MKKMIFSFAGIAMLVLFAPSAYSATFADHQINTSKEGEKNEITIGANRASGEMQLRFTSEKAGKASITILNESGGIVLQQTDEVTNKTNTIPLKNATGLKEGSYTVRLELNNETYTARFIIWK